MSVTRSRVQLDVQVMDQPLELAPQAVRRVGNAHPAPAPHVILEPTLRDVCDPHREDVHPPATVALHVVVATERFPRHYAAQSGFFLRFPYRRVARSLALVDRAFRYDPPLACGRRHERNLDALLVDPIGDHGCLLKYTRHLSSSRGSELCECWVHSGCQAGEQKVTKLRSMNKRLPVKVTIGR